MRKLTLIACLAGMIMTMAFNSVSAQNGAPRSDQFKPLTNSSLPNSPLPNSPTGTPAATVSSQTANQDPNVLDISPCGVKLIEDIEVPALVSGQLISVNVVPGKAISENDELGKIDDQLAQRSLAESLLRKEIAHFKATDESAIKVAEKTREFHSEAFKKTANLYQKGSSTQQDYTRDRLSLEIAEEELLKAENQRKQAEIETSAEGVKVDAARDNILRHTLRSTVNGNVLELIKHRGEWVNAGETVMRVARMDRLRVTGIVDGEKYDPREVANKLVTVTVSLARGRKVELQGKIVYVALEQSGGKNEYEVWAEIENQHEEGHWVLQSSSYVEMRVHLNK